MNPQSQESRLIISALLAHSALSLPSSRSQDVCWHPAITTLFQAESNRKEERKKEIHAKLSSLNEILGKSHSKTFAYFSLQSSLALFYARCCSQRDPVLFTSITSHLLRFCSDLKSTHVFLHDLAVIPSASFSCPYLLGGNAPDRSNALNS